MAVISQRARLALLSLCAGLTLLVGQAALAADPPATATKSASSPSSASSTPSTPAPSTTPLPLTCDAPKDRDSLMTFTIELQPEALSKVVFENVKPTVKLPPNVVGQAVVCACVDTKGVIVNGVKLMEHSGSSLLDKEAVEIAAQIVYPAGRAGCMRNSIDFRGPKS